MRTAIVLSISLGGALAGGPPAPAAPPPQVVAWTQLVPLDHPKTLPLPLIAQVTRTAGQVHVQVELDRNGFVAQAKALDGPLLLRPAAEAWCRCWRFKPFRVEGEAVRAISEATLDFHLKDLPPGAETPAAAVLTVAQGPSRHAVPVDLEPVQVKVRQWLEGLGLRLVGAHEIQPSTALAVKVEVQTEGSSKGACFFLIKTQGSLLDNPSQSVAAPTPNPVIDTHLIAIPDGARLQEAVLAALQGSLKELSEPQASMVFQPSPAKGDEHEGRPPVHLDFSQIKIRSRPPVPSYPPVAKMERIQGTVVVEVTVDPTGTPISAEAREGPPALLFTAMRYALGWRFQPAFLNGVPQYARFRLTMPFRLH